MLSVRPAAAAPARRRLLADGIDVDGSLTFKVTDGQQAAEALAQAEAFTQLLEDPEEINTVLEDVSGGGMTVGARRQ